MHVLTIVLKIARFVNVGNIAELMICKKGLHKFDKQKGQKTMMLLSSLRTLWDMKEM